MILGNYLTFSFKEPENYTLPQSAYKNYLEHAFVFDVLYLFFF